MDALQDRDLAGDAMDSIRKPWTLKARCVAIHTPCGRAPEQMPGSSAAWRRSASDSRTSPQIGVVIQPAHPPGAPGCAAAKSRIRSRSASAARIGPPCSRQDVPCWQGPCIETGRIGIRLHDVHRDTVVPCGGDDLRMLGGGAVAELRRADSQLVGPVFQQTDAGLGAMLSWGAVSCMA